MKDLYSVEYWGEDGSNFSYRLAIVYADSPEEAQDKAGVKQTERGFYPARKMPSLEYLDELEKVTKERNILKNIIV